MLISQTDKHIKSIVRICNFVSLTKLQIYIVKIISQLKDLRFKNTISDNVWLP